MADLAVVFHWPPPAMESMTLDDLMMWHDLARQRAEVQK
jgi:hypothetical protein